MVFERFTDRASIVAIGADREASKMQSPAIGSEHYLLGLFGLDTYPVVDALRSSGLTVDLVRHSVEKLFGQPVQARTGHVPYTREAKLMLDRAKV
ncbi:MAG TPA: Clp protease N-terminal domain-containing protein, partial [Candidatus Saccharimonadales bacterium]